MRSGWDRKIAVARSSLLEEAYTVVGFTDVLWNNRIRRPDGTEGVRLSTHPLLHPLPTGRISR